MAGPTVHHGLHHLHQRPGRLLRNHPPHDHRLQPPLLVGADSLTDDIGPHELPAVHKSGDGRQHLQRRHRDTLAEAVRRQVAATPVVIFVRANQPAGLAAQSHMGRLPETKALNVLIETVRAQQPRQPDHARIEAVLNNLGRRRRSARAQIPIANGHVAQRRRAVVVVRALGRHQPQLDRRRYGHGLEERPRLEDVRYNAVPVELGLTLIGQVQFAQTKARPARNRQDLTRGRVHHDDRAACGFMLLHRLIEPLLHKALDVAVDRED